MNFWCRILGHTWTQETASSDAHWNTTKKGFVLELKGPAGEVRYYDRCVRCDERREVPRPAAAQREEAALAAARTAAAAAAAGDDDEDEGEAEDESAA